MDFLWAPWRIKYIESARVEEGCIFCKGLREPDKRFVLDFNEKAMAIMNIYPYNPGHVMVAPTRHVGNFNDLDDDELLEISRMIKKAIRAIDKTMKPEGYNIGINMGQAAGAGVRDHIHIHIVPRWCGDTNFMPVTSDTKVLGEALEETYKKLKENWGD